MKNNSQKWLSLPMVAAALAAGITGCTDDHFAINSDVQGNSTIWQNIKSAENLSQYADILQSVYYSKSEDKTTPQTYADVLNGEQTFTVFAPVNGSFNYDYYKGLLSSGKRDSIYKVEKELILNNMARYAHHMNKAIESEKLTLLNKKKVTLNYATNSVKGSTIATANIPATNGALHIIDSPIEYQPNLYEYIEKTPALARINAFLESTEDEEFDEKNSIKGPTVNGQITWVDSVVQKTNTFTYDILNAYIEREDSNYAMILPTNDIWDTMQEKTQAYYCYNKTYSQTQYITTELGEFDDKQTGPVTEMSDEELDSITRLYSQAAILQNLAFNANWQSRGTKIASLSDIKSLDARRDSLKSTSDIKFKKTGTLKKEGDGKTISIDSYADMFGNNEPVEVSNGYAYVVDEYNLPVTAYAPRLEYAMMKAIEAWDTGCEDPTQDRSKTVYEGVTIINGTDTLTIDSTFQYSYMKLNSKNNKNPEAYFKLKDVMSCTYDIKLVVGWNSQDDMPNMFSIDLNYHEKDKDARTEKNHLSNPNEGEVDLDGKELKGTRNYVNRPPHFDADGKWTFNDTITVAKDFTFPVCYVGLDDAYPTLKVISNVSAKNKERYSRNLWIEAIILEPKEMKEGDIPDEE